MEQGTYGIDHEILISISIFSEEKKRIGAVNVRMRVKKSEDEEKLVTIRVPCKFG